MTVSRVKKTTICLTVRRKLGVPYLRNKKPKQNMSEKEKKTSSCARLKEIFLESFQSIMRSLRRIVLLPDSRRRLIG